MYILRQQNIAPPERQFSWHLCNIFWWQHWIQNKAYRLLYTSAQFCHNVVSLLASITMMLERAHAWPNSRWAIFFHQIDKNSNDGNDKKCFAIRILVAKI